MSSLNGLPGQKAKRPRVEAEAWCYTASKDEREFRFVWTIENFRGKVMKSYNNGNCLTSDAFEVEMGVKKTVWKLVCYPNGNFEENARNVSLFLKAGNTEAMNSRKFKYSLEIVGKDGSRLKKNAGLTSFSRAENSRGWPKYVSHEHMTHAKDDLFVEDSLAILCVMKFDGNEFTSISGISKASLTIPMESPEEDPGSVLLELLRTGYQADVEVVSQGRSFSCHKAILGTQSPVFRATLEHDMKEKVSGKITIEDIEPDIMEDMLTHIYGGKIENLEEKADRLLVVADKYDLEKLKKCCENILASTLDISNCLVWLVLADLHSTDRLKPVVVKFVAENLKEVADQDSWKDMHTNNPKVLLEVLNEVAFQPPK